MIYQTIQQRIQQSADQLFAQAKPIIKLDIPANPDHGDYAVNIAMSLAKQLHQSPMQIANQLVDTLKQDQELAALLSNIQVVTPGFINLTLSDQALLNQAAAFNQPINLHPDQPGQGRNIMVEYSSPNIAKPFNVGHLRSTIIGDSLANIYNFLGYHVIRDNHLGDWGTQYGKLAYAVEQWGDWDQIEADPIPELFKLYVRINEETKDKPELQEAARAYFKKLEDGDPHVRQLWQKLSDLSMADFSQLYQQFNVRFDVMLGESFYEPYLKEVIQECIEAGLAQESQGALVIFPPGAKPQDPPVIIRKSDGASSYDTRDLAGIRYRFKHYQLDKLIIEIGNEQQFYFQRIIAIAEAMGWVKPGQVVHVGHGLFLGSSGKKLSTRKGETVWLRELVKELQDKAGQIVADKSPNLAADQRQAIAQKVAIGALKYNDLSQNRLSNITFNKDKALSLDGNSAPYLQYTIARANSVLRASSIQRPVSSSSNSNTDTDTLTPYPSPLTVAERQLALSLLQFLPIVEQVATDYYPSHLATWLYQTAQKFNSFYQSDSILQAEPDIKLRRLALTQATSNLLAQGLNLLGVEVPDRM